jgi:hypothetical protein
MLILMMNKNQSELAASSGRVSLIILLIILVAASFLRLYKLDTGLWNDEILTHVRYMSRSLGEIITTYDDQNNHLLYTILARLSLMIFGDNAWALRLPAVFFGVGSILALYLLARQVAGSREALLSSSLLTLSYHHIWFSQNARGYTGLLFFTILSGWLLIRAINESKQGLWLAYAVVTALGVYTHMTMLFVVLGYFAVYLMTLWSRRNEEWPEKWKGLFLGFIAAGFLTLCLYSIVLPQIFGGTLWQGVDRIKVTEWKNPVWALFEVVRGMRIGFSGGIIALAAFLIFGAGFISFMREKSIVIYLFIIPALISAVVMIAMGYTLYPRFFFFTMGYGVLIAVRGTMDLGKLIVKIFRVEFIKAVHVGTVLCIGLIFVSAMSISSAYAPKQDFRGALSFVQSAYEQGDEVVTVGMTTFPYRAFYGTDWQSVETLSELKNIRARAKRTWLLYTMPLHMQTAYPEILNSLENDFKVIKQFHGTLGGGTIYVCRSDTLDYQQTLTSK